MHHFIDMLVSRITASRFGTIEAQGASRELEERCKAELQNAWAKWTKVDSSAIAIPLLRIATLRGRQKLGRLPVPADTDSTVSLLLFQVGRTFMCMPCRDWFHPGRTFWHPQLHTHVDSLIPSTALFGVGRHRSSTTDRIPSIKTRACRHDKQARSMKHSSYWA